MTKTHLTSMAQRTLSRAARSATSFLLFMMIAVPHVISADRSEYKPEGDLYVMESHFKWCGEAKSARERLKRYEKFWDMQRPRSADGYDDGRHIRMVRRCAYRLAALYAELGRRKDSVKMIEWLEKEDDTLDIAGG